MWPTLWPGDVIDDVMITDLYNLVIPMHSKFNDDNFVRFLVIMQNLISYLIYKGI